jgi:hypothetical protein
MKAIGLKRLIILLSVLGFNLAVAGSYFFVAEPMLQQTSQQVESTGSQISQVRKKIQNIKADLVEYQKNLPRYEVLKNAGFFSTQDRLEMTAHFQRVQSRSGLKRFSFNVENLQQIYTLPAGKENMVVLSSNIKINNPIGYFDTDFFNLIELMKTVFPAHVHFKELTLERAGPITTNDLKSISANAASTSLLKGEASFQWLTVIPQPKNTEDPNAARDKGRGRR